MARHAVLRSPRRARKERQQMARKVLLLALLCVAILGVALYGFSRPRFRIETIEVLGAARVAKLRVANAVEQELLGSYLGMIPKSHTLLYPKSAIKDRLLHQFPPFSQVSVSLRNLAALRVVVREREPVALWCARECVYIDEEGVAFAVAERDASRAYYRLEGAATEVALGTTLIGKKRLARLILFLRQLETLALAPERVVLRAVGDIEVGDIEVADESGVRLLLREGEYERALSHLQVLLLEDGVLPRSEEALSVTYIDLRYGNKVYFKPR